MQTIEADKVVTLHYTLIGEDGEVLDSSQGLEPLQYLHGHQNIIAGLEKGLAGAKLASELTLHIPPEEAYGHYDPELVQEVPLAQLANIEDVDKLEEGSFLAVESPEGPQVLTLVKLNADTATLDANHPLAGKTLTFNLSIEAIREATPEELAQGVVVLPK